MVMAMAILMVRVMVATMVMVLKMVTVVMMITRMTMMMMIMMMMTMATLSLITFKKVSVTICTETANTVPHLTKNDAQSYRVRENLRRTQNFIVQRTSHPNPPGRKPV